MAKLYYKFGIMGSGKTTELLQIAHDYELAEKKVLIFKPGIDSKGGNKIVSRMADISREVVILPMDFKRFDYELYEILEYDIILIDEAQFLPEEYVDFFMEIAHEYDIPVMCFGLRTTFDCKPFDGSSYLFALADSVEEVSTRAICKICGKKLATKNLRLDDGKPTFDGKTVEIDGVDVTYIPVCTKDYIALRNRTE